MSSVLQHRYQVRSNKHNNRYTVIDSLSALPVTMGNVPLVNLTFTEAQDIASQMSAEYFEQVSGSATISNRDTSIMANKPVLFALFVGAIAVLAYLITLYTHL